MTIYIDNMVCGYLGCPKIFNKIYLMGLVQF